MRRSVSVVGHVAVHYSWSPRALAGACRSGVDSSWQHRPPLAISVRLKMGSTTRRAVLLTGWWLRQLPKGGAVQDAVRRRFPYRDDLSVKARARPEGDNHEHHDQYDRCY
jgi:hypothetical protein